MSDALTKVAEAMEALNAANVAMDEAVEAAYWAGHTCQQIGDAAGISKQAAHYRMTKKSYS